MIEIHRVPSRLLPDLWPGLKPFAVEAAEHNPFMEAEDLLAACLVGNAQCFLLLEEGGIVGFVAMEVLNYPRRRVASVLALGGRPGLLDASLPTLREALVAWAHEQGADTLAVIGRPGWMKALRDEGFDSVTHVTLSLRLGGHGTEGRVYTAADDRIGALETGSALPH